MPIDGDGIVMLGESAVAFIAWGLPTGDPSSRKVTVPVGATAPPLGGVTAAVSVSVPAGEGVVVDGVSVTVGAACATVTVTVVEVDAV